MQGYRVVVFGAAEPSVANTVRFIFVCYWSNIGNVIKELWKCYSDYAMLHLMNKRPDVP